MASPTLDAADVPPSRAVGASIRRREDAPLLTGEARFSDDIQDQRGLHLAILRSPYGHARIEGIDTSAAEAVEGVVAVYTHEDLVASGIDPALPGDDPEFGTAVSRPLLAAEGTNYHGEAVAAVVAEDRYTAHEAADLIEVDYERLDAVAEARDALAPEAPAVHEAVPDNVALEWTEGDQAATERAFGAADRTVEIDLSINRIVAVPMEPRAAVARYRASTGALTLEHSCQNVTRSRSVLAQVLDHPESKITVRAPDVGGAFGVKAQPYTGHVLTAWAATQLGRPVKWAATRTEAFLSTNHSRRHDVTARAALDADGHLTGLHVESVSNVGAYLTTFGSYVPTGGLGTRLLGAYDIPAAYVEVTGAYTNTTTLGPYRGAGRPEAAYVIERLADACARELDEDPVDFRRRNFIQPEQFPYETPLDSSYDSGDYEAALDRALDLADYDTLRERQRAAREEGRFLGIGVSTYIEICGGYAGDQQGATVRLRPTGDAVAMTATVENGQGHRTSYAQIVQDVLGVEDVEVVEGDTDRVPEGGGTGGSRSIPMGGSAIREAAEAVRERARAIAAHELEAAPEDLAFDQGAFHVRGAPDRSMHIRDVAGIAYSGTLPDDLRGLDETAFYSPTGSTAPFGTHLAVVEVDRETGQVILERFVAVDDVGTQINPTLVEGQIVGGAVQSVGQALFEGAVYDENATLQSGSLQDYALPRAADVPEVEWDSTVTPSPNNTLGVKGVGEAGTIGAMPAVVNAVVDALAPLGVAPEELDMPLTAERVWQAIEAAD